MNAALRISDSSDSGVSAFLPTRQYGTRDLLSSSTWLILVGRRRFFPVSVPWFSVPFLILSVVFSNISVSELLTSVRRGIFVAF